MNIRRYRFYRQVEGIADVTLYSTLDEVVLFKFPVIEHKFYCLDFYVSDTDYDPAIISIEAESLSQVRSILRSVKNHMRFDLSTIDMSDLGAAIWKNDRWKIDPEFKKKFEI